MRTVIAALVAVLLLQQSYAAGVQKGTFHVYGPTSVSCGAFTASDGTHREIYNWWVLGFLSGFNRARIDQAAATQLRDTDSDGAMAFVVKYCTDHPLDTLVAASVALVKELDKK